MNTTTDHAELEVRLRALTQRTLSSPARYFHVAVLVLALIMCSLLGALLVTETDLPGRTQLAFSALLALGMGWVLYAGWVLTRRNTLLVHQQVVAGWMAVGGTGAFFICSAVAAWIATDALAMAAVGAAATLLGGAVWLLARSTHRLGELKALRRTMERT
ncbi:hypothetical protein [Stenotrophomonas oahuensis]|uniref:Transmembrane protein n=1 Tax=Stenotrophomonas oahuensis TaxID=3003271 RepID=A0ABY9YNR6_9GAMM|nr:hypothetical protein [Stenotrophomonas sp. A5586]WNH52534.1 hypothetical protein PDM29_19800 [Stenotrophomonas sp. A5586]